MKNNQITKIFDTFVDMWIGFCVGWLWFGNDSFWKVFSYEIIGIIIILVVRVLVYALVEFIKENKK